MKVICLSCNQKSAVSRFDMNGGNGKCSCCGSRAVEPVRKPNRLTPQQLADTARRADHLRAGNSRSKFSLAE